MTRKSPVRHNVKPHTRKGKNVRSYNRGKGLQKLQINKVKIPLRMKEETAWLKKHNIHFERRTSLRRHYTRVTYELYPFAMPIAKDLTEAGKYLKSRGFKPVLGERDALGKIYKWRKEIYHN